jgi:predicted oxidoreductase
LGFTSSGQTGADSRAKISHRPRELPLRHLGGSGRSPNPCVAPIERAPFYALRIYPADLGTAVGLRTDSHARVLKKDGTILAGLYACGNERLHQAGFGQNA